MLTHVCTWACMCICTPIWTIPQIERGIFDWVTHLIYSLMAMSIYLLKECDKANEASVHSLTIQMCHWKSICINRNMYTHDSCPHRPVCLFNHVIWEMKSGRFFFHFLSLCTSHQTHNVIFTSLYMAHVQNRILIEKLYWDWAILLDYVENDVQVQIF